MLGLGTFTKGKTTLATFCTIALSHLFKLRCLCSVKLCKRLTDVRILSCWVVDFSPRLHNSQPNIAIDINNLMHETLILIYTFYMF